MRYVARHRDRWLALAVFSTPALKCGARDRRIGWHRSRIRAGHEPENTTLLRRFATVIIKARGSPSRRRCAGWAGTCGACSTS
ncbi:MAG: hypothetical protein F4145_12820 [Boseongicola sp. SB0675_bin_26]|nr:hypothetical protein [Boseongicola sp. SB0675_bin_26]